MDGHRLLREANNAGLENEGDLDTKPTWIDVIVDPRKVHKSGKKCSRPSYQHKLRRFWKRDVGDGADMSRCMT
jgi:hypothetical protein